ncbi:MAG: hypothetical protein RL685_7326, partial [Pseudomonadota bacterium]
GLAVLGRVLDVLILPKEISAFERQYLARVNRLTMQFFVLHTPVFILVAWFNDTNPLLALLLTAAVAAGPVLAYRTLQNPRSVGLVYGFTAMLMGGLLVHFGQGPVQIEMHFYFFALLAMLALYGNPMAILVAAVTVAVHHLLLWLLLPSSVFNYAAPWWVVGVHAGFVVLESVATVYIARSFFDNVIGLERVVQERTRQLDQRNQAMRLVLDNVEQGLLTIDEQGLIQPEHSRALERWFGQLPSGQPLEQFLAGLNPSFAANFALALEQCREGMLPVEVCVAQAPQALAHHGRHYHFEYRPLPAADGSLSGLLVVIADVTSDVERQRLEVEQTEALNILDRVLVDRTGFLEFFHEAEDLLAALSATSADNLAPIKRALHTLKGNCMIFGVQTVADLCHRLETAMVEQERPPTPGELAELRAAWQRLSRRLGMLLGEGDKQRIEVEPAQFDDLLRAAVSRRDPSEIARLVADIKLESTATRLNRIAAQAKRIARRVNKEDVEVQIDDSMLRLEPRAWASFWAAFIHVIRNAIDHGIESKDVRSQAGKAGAGRLQLRTRMDGAEFVIEASDDGAGIQWQKVRERASQLGLPHDTQEQLVDALFVDGLSTAAEVSELSGRGVGLAAVSSACLELGGKIQVQSEAGKGTSFVFRFPRSVISINPAAMLQNAEQSPRSHVA